MTVPSAPSSRMDSIDDTRPGAVTTGDDCSLAISDEARNGVLRWLLSGNVGLSSRAMAAHLLGVAIEDPYDRIFHPLDGGDFSRCVALLDAAPELRNHLSRMKTLSPTWAVLVDHWEEIEAFYKNESGRDHRLPMTTALIGCIQRKAAEQQAGPKGAA